MWRSNKVNNGFTLIELIVTMGLIAVLSAGVVALIGQGPRRYSRDSQRQADLQQIRSALEMYRNDFGGYPSTTAPLSPLYLTTGWPADPSSPGRNYAYLPNGCVAGRCTSYTLCAAGEKSPTPAVGCGSCGATCSFKVVNP